VKTAAIGALLLALAPGLATAREAVLEQCKAMVGGPAAGQFTAVPAPRLRLVGHIPAGALPPPPEGLRLVECGRDAIVPTPNDVKVLIDYRVPLSITDGERVAFLEVDKGQVHLRMAQGDLTPQELGEVRRRLDTLQLAFNRSNEAHGR